MAVDYLTRYQLTGNLNEAFAISLKGAEKIGKLETAEELLGKIHGLDEESVLAAIELSSFDVVIRNPMAYVNGGWNYSNGCRNAPFPDFLCCCILRVCPYC